MGKIIAVCRSDKKGTRKKVTAEGSLSEGYGLVSDAHADSSTHRQVSLLAVESINRMRHLGVDVGAGDFAENLTTEGLDLVSLPVGTRVSIGEDTILEITQIGKECHDRCAIFHQVGDCVMPREGIFTRVLRGGSIKPGDDIRVLSEDET